MTGTVGEFLVIFLPAYNLSFWERLRIRYGLGQLGNRRFPFVRKDDYHDLLPLAILTPMGYTDSKIRDRRNRYAF